MHQIRFRLNDRDMALEGAAPTTTLLRYLRDTAGLTGTKEGCAEGDCGACTVAVVDRRADGKPTYRAVNSCLVFLPMLQGKDVYTVEALKDRAGHHPVQASLASHMGSQCGYCTPGIVMALFEAAYREDLTEGWQVEDQMCGNLCRCTGYKPIRDAATEVAGARPKDRFLKVLDDSQARPMEVSIDTSSQHYANPASLDAMWEELERHPGARFVCGGTDLALEVTKRFQEPPVLVSTEGIPELRRIEEQADRWIVGAAVTLTELQEALKETILPLEKMIRWFASRQIKNRATIGGNICTASPIGDLPPVLLALGASVTIASKAGQRTIPLDAFFLSYRKTALAPGELLSSITIPKIGAHVRATSFKVSKRRELDISAVSAGCWARVEGGEIREIRLAFGGVAATPVRAKATELFLTGQPWSRSSFEAAREILDSDFKPISDHRGSAWYRQTVAKNLVLGFFLECERGPATLDGRPSGTIHIAGAEAGR